MKRLTRTVEAPGSPVLGIDGVIGVQEKAPVALDLRLESVMEGVLVTGTAVRRPRGVRKVSGAAGHRGRGGLPGDVLVP